MIKPNLKRFCATDECRPQLHHPYNVGDHTYASNGKIAIRIPVDAKYQRDRSDLPKPPTGIKEIFSDAITQKSQWIDLPLDQFSCKDKKTKCEYCHGSGAHQCDCDHCNNDCEACEGHGYALYPPEYKFTNDVIISGEYLEELNHLPGPVQVSFGKKEGPHAFRGPGWYVLIMPLRNGDANPVNLNFPKCEEVPS